MSSFYSCKHLPIYEDDNRVLWHITVHTYGAPSQLAVLGDAETGWRQTVHVRADEPFALPELPERPTP